MIDAPINSYCDSLFDDLIEPINFAREICRRYRLRQYQVLAIQLDQTTISISSVKLLQSCGTQTFLCEVSTAEIYRPVIQMNIADCRKKGQINNILEPVKR